MVAIEEVLNELGWDDGFRIPVANEENKQLEEEIQSRIKCRATLKLELETIEERVTAMVKHAVNVTLEHDHNQKLLTAHSAQLDAEDHLYRTSNSTNSNISQEIRRLEKEKKDIADRISIRENELAKNLEKLEGLKKAAKFEKDRLQQWDEALSKEEESSQLVEKYMKLDRKKFKELELKRQKLNAELKTSRQALIRAIDEIHEMEIILDRTARSYVSALKARSELIHQWTQSVLVLRQRDNDIQNGLKEIETLREVGREKMNVLQEAEQFLDNQVLNNKQSEELIKQLERKLVLTKEEHRRLTDTISAYTIEVATQKKTLENLGRSIRQARTKIKQKKIDIQNRKLKIENWNKQIEDLKRTLEEIDNQRLNVEDRTRQLEEMIEKEERRKAFMIKEVNRLQGLILRATSRMTEMESERKVLDVQSQNERKKVDLLVAFRAKEEKRLKDQKEAIYHVDMDVQRCEMKLRHLIGLERDKDTMEKKQKILDNLQKAYNEKAEISKLLQTQITNLEHDMRKLSNSLANDEDELRRLKNKKQDLMLLMEGGEKQLRTIECRNEEKQVEENILRLRVSQTEQMRSSIGDKVYNLEKYKLQIEAAMQERKVEIKVHQESLAVQKRLIASDCSELRNAIAERKFRIQQLQTRYDSTINALGSTADGTPLTATYLKIQSAQEKYALQEQGDKLDETIRRTEHEIRSMENTLRVVNASNDRYRMSLGTVDENGLEQAEQRELDEETFDAFEKMRQKRAQMERVEADLEIMERNYDQLLEDVEKAEEEKLQKRRLLDNLERQIAEQQEKQSRADKSLRKVFKDVQNSCLCTDDSVLLLQERDLSARQIREQNGLALQRIAEFTVRHIEAEAYLKGLLSSKNMALPPVSHLKSWRATPPSRCESSASSVSSKTSSRKSVRGATGPQLPSRESIGHVVDLTTCFESVSSTETRSTRRHQTARSTTSNSCSKRFAFPKK